MSSKIVWTCDICGKEADGDKNQGWVHTQFLAIAEADWAPLALCGPDCIAAAEAKVEQEEWFKLGGL